MGDINPSQILDFRQTLSNLLTGEVDPKEQAKKDFAYYLENAVHDERPKAGNEFIKLAPIHREMAAALVDPQYKFVLIEAPRGAGKSVTVNSFLAHQGSNDPNLRFLLASEIADKAADQLNGVESVLRSPEHQAIFGNLIPERSSRYKEAWTALSKTLIRSRFSRFPTYFGAGCGSSAFVGKRADVIVCVPGDSLVQTDHGLRPISDISRGDLVLTHKGRMRKVETVFRRPFDGELVSIWVSGSASMLRATSEHPVWVWKRTECRSSSSFCTPDCPRREAECPFMGYPRFVPAGKIKHGDFIGIPYPTRTLSPTEIVGSLPWLSSEKYNWRFQGLCPEHLLMGDFWRLIGYWLAEGSVNPEKSYIQIAFSENEAKWQMDAQGIIQRLLGKKSSIQYGETHTGVVCFSDSRLACFLRSILKPKKGNTRLKGFHNHRWILELPLDLQLELIKGYARGDGCWDERLSLIRVASVSYDLLHDFMLMAARFGDTTGIQKGSDVNKYQSGFGSGHALPRFEWRIPFRSRLGYALQSEYKHLTSRELRDRKLQLGRSFISNGYIWAKASPREKSPCSEVFNLAVEEDQSYVLATGAVHNCDDIQSLSSAISPAENQHVKDWFFRELLQTNPDAKVIYICTPWCNGDAADEIAKVMKGKPYFKHIHQEAVIDLDTPQQRSYWPEAFPLEVLLRIREINPYAFDNQYMLKRMDMTNAFFKRSQLKVIPESEIPGNLTIYQGIDPAGGGDKIKLSDFFTMATVGIDSNRVGYLLDMIRVQGNIQEAIEQTKANISRWHPKIISIEISGQQRWTKEYLEAELKVQLNEVPTHSVPKVLRIREMAKHFASAQVLVAGTMDWTSGELVPLTALEPFAQEFGTYPVSGHDDTLDAVDVALKPIFSYGGSLASITIQPSHSRPKEGHQEDKQQFKPKVNLPRMQGLLGGRLGTRFRVRSF